MCLYYVNYYTFFFFFFTSLKCLRFDVLLDSGAISEYPWIPLCSVLSCFECVTAPSMPAATRLFLLPSLYFYSYFETYLGLPLFFVFFWGWGGYYGKHLQRLRGLRIQEPKGQLEGVKRADQLAQHVSPESRRVFFLFVCFLTVCMLVRGAGM